MPGSFDVAALPPRYRLKQELGHGGMAVVYLADDAVTSTEVAVKLLRPELVASVSAARFLREIRYLRVLRHPHILPILDATEGGLPLFLVTPFIAGPTLREMIQTGPIPLPQVMSIVRQLADALDYAHDRNIVHRDLKPENVLFDGDHAVLCDFGIARAIVVSANEELLSSSGIAVGTPPYMSPEQVLHDEPIDGRSDVYALGCVTFEMITGEAPFGHTNPQILVASLLSRTVPSMRHLRPDIPVGADDAVRKALSRDLAERPRRASAFADAISTAFR